MSPVFAADGIITGGAGTCTVDVLGVFENDATANTIATWTLNEYECGAGQYLLNSDGTLKCTECPVGSYCPGGKFTVESENNGVNTCPTDYTSDAGAVGENECYMGCELACSKNVECPPHSNNCTHSEFKTTGKQFAGGTCNAYPSVCPIADFGCDTGYSKESVAFEPVAAASEFEIYMSLECSLHGQEWNGFFGMFDNGFNDCELLEPGQALYAGRYLFEMSINSYDENTPGVLTGDGYPHPDQQTVTVYPKYLPNADFQRTITGDNKWLRLVKIGMPTPATELLMKFMESDENIYSQDAKILLNYLEDVSEIYSMLKADDADAFVSQAEQELRKNLSTKNVNKVIEVMKRTKNGEINSEQDLKSELFNIIFTEVASYNHVDSISPEMLSLISIYNNDDVSDQEKMGALIKAMFSSLNFVETNSPWVTNFWALDGGSDLFGSDTILSGVAFGDDYSFAYLDKPVTASYCNSNTINIDWNPDNGGAHIQNMCYYDGAVTLPSDPVKPGYTFTGWKLVE